MRNCLVREGNVGRWPQLYGNKSIFDPWNWRVLVKLKWSIIAANCHLCIFYESFLTTPTTGECVFQGRGALRKGPNLLLVSHVTEVNDHLSLCSKHSPLTLMHSPSLPFILDIHLQVAFKPTKSKSFLPESGSHTRSSTTQLSERGIRAKLEFPKAEGFL